MSTLSRRQFLRASGTVVGATLVPSLGLSGRARAAERELVPKKMPFPASLSHQTSAHRIERRG